jgi:hypothetical protein
MMEEVRLDEGKTRERRHPNYHAAKAFSPGDPLASEPYCATGQGRRKSRRFVRNPGNVGSSLRLPELAARARLRPRQALWRNIMNRRKILSLSTAIAAFVVSAAILALDDPRAWAQAASCPLAGRWKNSAGSGSIWSIDSHGTAEEAGLGGAKGTATLNDSILVITFTTKYANGTIAYAGNYTIGLTDCNNGSGSLTWTDTPSRKKEDNKTFGDIKFTRLP